MCLGNLQRLKNRFGNGYALRVKGCAANIDQLKDELRSMVPGLRMDGKSRWDDRCSIVEQHDDMLFCTVPSSGALPPIERAHFVSLARIFEWLNERKNAKSIESYSITQTTLEQIFVRVAGEDQTGNDGDN